MDHPVAGEGWGPGHASPANAGPAAAGGANHADLHAPGQGADPAEGAHPGGGAISPLSGKPIYDSAGVVYALTTFDGAAASSAWAGNTVTYSISSGDIAIGQPGYRSEYAGYQAMTPFMQQTAAEAFELWDDLVAIDFVASASDPGADILFNYSSATSGNGTYASSSFSFEFTERADWALAKTQIWASDSWWTQDQDADLYQGGYGITTYMHEIGHALGLSHPGNYNGSGTFAADATHDQDTRGYTVMSYFQADANGSDADHRANTGVWRYGATPLLHDVLAAQAVYGADMTTRTGDTTYGFNSNAGRAAFDFTLNNAPVVAIWDAGGIDTLDASGYADNQVITLVEGAFSSIGLQIENVAIAFGAVIERAFGGSGNDMIIGNDAANLLVGGGGADTLIGGLGNDTLSGEAGNDRLEGGEGDDVLLDYAGDAVLIGGAGNDILNGGAGADSFDGGDGRDVVRYANAAAGVIADLVAGGTGSDAQGDSFTAIEDLVGSLHADSLTGDAGANSIDGLDGDDTLDGGAGDDWLTGGAGADRLIGGAGIDTADYSGNSTGIDIGIHRPGSGAQAQGDSLDGIEHIVGTALGDTLIGGLSGSITLDGGTGSDLLYDYGADALLIGGGGVDFLVGGGGNDTLDGGALGDWLSGGDGADVIDGGDGDDWLSFANVAAGGVAANLATGLGSQGQAAGDTYVNIENMIGSAFADILTGDGGFNRLFGGAGDDILTGGGGNDYLWGGAGADRFVFDTTSWGRDLLIDFEDGIDLIDLAGSGLTFADFAEIDSPQGTRLDWFDGTTTLAIHVFGVNPDQIDENDFV